MRARAIRDPAQLSDQDFLDEGPSGASLVSKNRDRPRPNC